MKLHGCSNLLQRESGIGPHRWRDQDRCFRFAYSLLGPHQFPLLGLWVSLNPSHKGSTSHPAEKYIVEHEVSGHDFFSADGKPVHAKLGALTIPAGSRNLVLHWIVKPRTPQLSYDHAVAAYKSECARRYEALLHGEPATKR